MLKYKVVRKLFMASDSVYAYNQTFQQAEAIVRLANSGDIYESFVVALDTDNSTKDALPILRPQPIKGLL